MEWNIVFQAIISAVMVVAAAVWLKSSLVKQRHQELENLAATRGERVGDLEARIEELRSKVAALRSEVDALYKLKAVEIGTVAGDRVVEAVVEAVVGAVAELIDNDPS